MEKKWVLVTGASSGIGKSVAAYLDSVGYSTVLIARRSNLLHETASSFQNEAHCITYDLQDLENLESIFITCKEHGIKFHGFVHCAGIGNIISVRGNIVEEMQAVMTTNYFSFVELVKSFGSKKYSEAGASIVAISSISPLTCYTGACNYAASKSAVNTAVKVMAKEYMQRKIRVNAILPGYVNTPMGPAEDDANYLAQQPLGIIKAEYIAYLVEFLLSEKSKYMTGAWIPVSGGMCF